MKQNFNVPSAEFSLFDSGKTHLTKDAAYAMVRWHNEMHQSFSDEGKRHATLLSHPLAALENVSKRPPVAVAMAEVLARDLHDYEHTGQLFGKSPRGWQVGATQWLMASLLHQGSSYLFEGGTGVGKTFILGESIRAATQAQIEGVLDGTIVVIFEKPHLMDQQVFAPEDRGERVASESLHHTELSRICEHAKTFLPKKIAESVTNDFCIDLRQKECQTPEEMLEKIVALLKKKHQPHNVEVAREGLLRLAHLLLGQTLLIGDIDAEQHQELKLPRRTKQEDVEKTLFSGDMLRGVPSSYIEEGKVATTVNGLTIGGETVRRISDTNRKEVKLLLATQSAFNGKHKTDIAAICARAEVVIVDEARMAASNYQERILKKRELMNIGTEKKSPLVFMASALSETDGIAYRPSADSYSPKLLITEAMDKDRLGQKIAADMALDVSPRGSNEVLYPTFSQETLARAIELHFDVPSHLEGMEHSIPWQNNAAIVTELAAIPHYVDALREEYAKRKTPAQIVAFSLQQESGPERMRRERAVLAWLAAEESAEERQQRGPKIVVIPEGAFRDALSLSKIHSVIFATGKKMGLNTLGRRMGRLSHVPAQGKPEGFRTLARQVLTSETKATVFDALTIHTDSPTREFVPGRIVRGQEGAQSDAERTQHEQSLPAPTGESVQKMRHESGTPLPEGIVRKEIDASVQAAWEKAVEALESAASGAEFKKWGNSEVRVRFHMLILNTLWPPFKKIVRLLSQENWKHALTLKIVACDSAEDMLYTALSACEDIREKGSIPLQDFVHDDDKKPQEVTVVEEAFADADDDDIDVDERELREIEIDLHDSNAFDEDLLRDV